MYLYVWPEFCPSFSNGLAFAIAENEADARRMVQELEIVQITDWGKVEIHDLSTPLARSARGGD